MPGLPGSVRPSAEPSFWSDPHGAAAVTRGPGRPTRAARPARAAALRLLPLSLVALPATLLGLAFAGSEARAVPSFARQVGVECTACHTAFPELTPFGRAFKLEGYTLSDQKTHLPPLAVMLQGAPGFTHTRKDQPEGDLPSDFHDNDNVSLNQISLFYAGRLFGPYAEDLFGERVAKVLDKVGVFSQGTWDGVEQQWAWDNMEIRAAQPLTFAGKSAVVGAYVNNNPTLQDLWNTTPAWGFPFSGSGLAPTPDAAPLIAGGVSQQVLGFGGYTMLGDLLYLDAGAYATLSAHAQRDLGVDPAGETEIDGLAPYWRVALEKIFGPHVVEIGTYGLHASTFPARDESAGDDRFTDVGVDLEYQWLTQRHDVTLLANWIYELQDLHASRQLGLASNGSNDLWTVSVTGSYLFDKTYGIDVQYFHTDGDADALLYGSRTGRPDSNGWIFQVDWLPLNRRGGPKFWPRSNLKLSLQYTLYLHFDGSRNDFDGEGRNASDNDTLYVQAWIAF